MRNKIKSGMAKVFFASFLTVFLFSCEKVTDLKPYSTISDASAFSSPSLIELTMVGVYNNCQSGYYNNGQAWFDRGYPFGAASIQQGEARGEDVVNTQAFYAITYQGTYDASSSYNNISMWLALYAVVNSCNIMIDGVKAAGAKNVISAEAALDYEAQARFLRALSYHELLIHFAKPYNDGNGNNPGLPLRTKAVTSATIVNEEMKVGRSTVAETYKFVLDDLDFAEANISKTRKSITRVTLGAVLALKNRVYLHMSNWDKVIETGNALTGYSLTTSPEGPFASFANNTESIFSMENSATDNAGANGALPNMLNGNGRKILAISPILWNQSWWLQTDLRRTLCSEDVSGNKYSKKYRDFTNNTDYTPLIRYAEVVLNMAEAYARKNDFTNALAKLNLVRNRAVTTAANQFTSTSFTNQNDWLTAILRERRIEFAMEGRRWADIHRLVMDPVFTTNGIPGKVPNGYPKAYYKSDGTGYSGPLNYAFPYTDKRFLWPIPQNETNSNPTLAGQQNPGW